MLTLDVSSAAQFVVIAASLLLGVSYTLWLERGRWRLSCAPAGYALYAHERAALLRLRSFSRGYAKTAFAASLTLLALYVRFHASGYLSLWMGVGVALTATSVWVVQYACERRLMAELSQMHSSVHRDLCGRSFRSWGISQ